MSNIQYCGQVFDREPDSVSIFSRLTKIYKTRLEMFVICVGEICLCCFQYNMTNNIIFLKIHTIQTPP